MFLLVGMLLAGGDALTLLDSKYKPEARAMPELPHRTPQSSVCFMSTRLNACKKTRLPSTAMQILYNNFSFNILQKNQYIQSTTQIYTYPPHDLHAAIQ
jgi:hypothetical protein